MFLFIITEAVSCVLVILHPGIHHDDGTNTIVRSRILEESLLAGIAMLYSGLGLIHAVANTIGGMYHDLPHGLIISHLIGEILQFNRPAISKHKYDEVQQQMEETLSAIEIVQI